MQRRIAFTLIIVLCSSVLLACGGEAAAPMGSTPPPANEIRPNPNQQRPLPTQAAQAPAAATEAPPAAATEAPMDVQPPAAATEAPAAATEAPAADPWPNQNMAQATPMPTNIASDDPYDSTFYQNYGTNPFVSTLSDAQSTFAMDVDTASYGVMRRYISDGNLPNPDSVRVEEYVNYFNYQYPQPENGTFAIYTEAAPSPFGGTRYDLVQIGIQARSIQAADRKPTALTFVIDGSGSMQQENRIGTVKQALALVVQQMRDDDTIAVVVYGSNSQVVLPPTSGASKRQIMNAINNLQANGSTNAEAGLRDGFDMAGRAYIAGGINMILLCSDGVANNGITDPAALLQQYQGSIDDGVQLSTFGFGMGNFNDVLMEQLADGGNGSYAYIDTLDEAERVFVQNLNGTLQTVARDAKIQVEFNPQVVSRYRLLGYENRDVADQDFRNDAVDAGEVGAGHNVTALYEVRRVDGASGELATIRVRYQRPNDGIVVEEAQSINTSTIRPDVDSTTPRFKLAASVAQFAELLRYSFWAKGEALEDVLDLADQAARGYNNDPDVVEFVDLLNRAAQLAPVVR